MLPASNKGPSLSFGFPDVCLTPVGPLRVPIPYPNFAAHAMAVAFAPNVLVGMIPALNLASIIPMTTGDEPGVVHWTVMGLAAFTLGNPVVYINNLPGINLTSLGTGNKGNLPLNTVIAPGAPNVLYTLAEGDVGRLEGAPLEGEARFVAAGVACLRVRVFSWRLPAAVDAALAALARLEDVRALVLDLRGCPGGELGALVALASDFLPRGAPIVTVTDAEGDAVCHRARGGPAHTMPLALLVDGGTASAAELFAAALKAHGRALVVGSPTHGKDTGQVLVRGPTGALEAMTAARLTPPGGGERWVPPHVEVGDGEALAVAVEQLTPA